MLNTLEDAARSAATLLKVLLLSRKPSRPIPAEGDSLVVMGNGPSLRNVLDSDLSRLAECHTMAVNFAANAPEFFEIRPCRYILADPHFFAGYSSDPNVARLWSNIAKARWPMTLHIPAPRRKDIPVSLPDSIRICLYNLTPGEGLHSICYPLFRKGLAMPRPRNVLIPAIMEGIRAGFPRIVIIGADHTWSRTLSVDESNRVVSVQPHFYKDNEKELKRVSSEYEGYRLHDILHSLTVAFRSYHEIAAYAKRRGVDIVNATPGSFIDAFPREKF